MEDTGSIVWLCMPRFDSEPVCGRLLDPQGGDFTLGPADGGRGVQRYLDNTNVLETTFTTPEGSFRVLDFAPRFEQHSRTFRPTQLLRVMEPIHGAPRVRAHFRPVEGWSKKPATAFHASHHLHFTGPLAPLRLTTDVPLAWLEGKPFVLTGPRRFALTWAAPIEEPLAPLVDRFLGETIRYWQRWVKQCNIPPLFQKEVIRSALALKLCCHEDTGAIVAALTTSIPEAAASGRTWDYRFCWLRDAYYTLDALRLLGQFDERQAFIDFLLSIAAATGGPLDLKPLYRVDGLSDLDESVLDNWAGFEGHGPVRVGNQAASHVQHDVYGEMVLALAPIYFDERFAGERSHATLELLHRLAGRAIEVAGTPDAGLWEYRSGWREHTFSTVMSWAAAERAGRVGTLMRQSWGEVLTRQADDLRTRLLSRAWSESLGSFTVSPGMDGVDAALLQLPALRLLSADDKRLHATIDVARKALERDGWLLRYQTDDGFGVPTVAFTLCTFWLAQALAVCGRRDEARAVLKKISPAPNALGLWSEDIDPKDGRLWGNFPQAYSHVGLIHAAFAASPNWAEML